MKKSASIILLVIGIVIAVLVCAISIALYGRVYFFDGYAITKFAWVVVICCFIGSVSTYILSVEGFGGFNMYSNIGKKIKALAVVLGWILLIAGLITAFVTLVANSRSSDDTIGWLGLAAGAVGLISSWPLYAFGQLVEDTNALRNHFAAEKTAEKKSEPAE